MPSEVLPGGPLEADQGSEEGAEGLVADAQAGRVVRRWRVRWDRLLLVLAALGLGLTAWAPWAGGHPHPEPDHHAAARAIVVEFRKAGANRAEAAQALAVASWESTWRQGWNPEARNRKCCAAGLFQITKGTWNRYAEEAGAPQRGSRTAVEVNRWVNSRVAAVIWAQDGWRQWSVVNPSVEPHLRFDRLNLDWPLDSLPAEYRRIAEAELDRVFDTPQVLLVCC